MTQIMRTERGCKLCGLAQFGNNLPNTALSQRPTLAKEEMPIRPAAPGRNRFSPESSSLTPAFGELLTMGEIRIERFACFLDQWDLAMLESLASADNQQPAPCGDLYIGELESRNF